MKEGWTYKRLGDIAEIIHGKNQKDVISEDGQYPIYGSGGNVMGYATDYLCEANTTILGRKGSINNPQFITERFWNVDTAFGIFAKNGNDSKFIYYFIKSIDWSKKNTGTTLPSLTQQVVKSVELSVPPLAEQERIVERLDAAFAQIDELKSNAERQLAEARALFQSALTQAMQPKPGWQEKKLKEIGLTQTGTTPSKSDKSNYGDYIPYIRPSEIDYDGCGSINYDCEMKLSDKGLSMGRLFKKHSVLMVCIGATISKVGFSSQDISCNQQINVLYPSDEYHYKYIYYAMCNDDFKRKVIKEGTSAQATLPIINKSKWENLTLFVPDIDEQQRISNHLDSLSSNVLKLEEISRKAAAECEALKQALLRQIFE